MSDKDWIRKAQELAKSETPMEAFRLFMQHKDEAVNLFFGEKACASTEAAGNGCLFERDTREVAQIVAKWSICALPLDEDVLSITVDVSQSGEPPLVTARTEGGEVILFDVNEASRANEDHLEDCRHVEASWCDWQDDERFLPLFCETLTAVLTEKGLPTPEYIR